MLIKNLSILSGQELDFVSNTNIKIQNKIFKNESLPENKEISSEELEDQEKIKEGSDELVDPKSSDKA